MSDLVEFLRARLDEDEREAAQDYVLVPNFEDAGKPRDEWPRVPGEGPNRRMQREVEAKRRILAAHAEHPTEPHFCRTCGGTAGPCETKRLLALPYADHPDYREEWRP